MKVIGATTKYIGHEISGAHGETMRIVQVLHYSMLPETDMDLDENHATNDDELEHIGGVTKHDRLETYIIKADGTRAPMSFDPRAIDLEMFAHLA
jgi:hypothetical protein